MVSFSCSKLSSSLFRATPSAMLHFFPPEPRDLLCVLCPVPLGPGDCVTHSPGVFFEMVPKLLHQWKYSISTPCCIFLYLYSLWDPWLGATMWISVWISLGCHELCLLVGMLSSFSRLWIFSPPTKVLFFIPIRDRYIHMWLIFSHYRVHVIPGNSGKLDLWVVGHLPILFCPFEYYLWCRLGNLSNFRK